MDERIIFVVLLFTTVAGLIISAPILRALGVCMCKVNNEPVKYMRYMTDMWTRMVCNLCALVFVYAIFSFETYVVFQEGAIGKLSAEVPSYLFYIVVIILQTVSSWLLYFATNFFLKKANLKPIEKEDMKYLFFMSCILMLAFLVPLFIENWNSEGRTCLDNLAKTFVLLFFSQFLGYFKNPKDAFEDIRKAWKNLSVCRIQCDIVFIAAYGAIIFGKIELMDPILYGFLAYSILLTIVSAINSKTKNSK